MAETNQEVIDFFLKENCRTMTVRELAAETGFSRSAICRRLQKLGLKTRGAHAHAREAGQAGQNDGPRARSRRAGDMTEKERLEEVRDILHGMLADANASNAARISSEYRAVLERISEIDAEDDGGEDDGFDLYE